jgi:hypothetical protein
MNKIIRILNRSFLLLIVLSIVLSGCEKNFLSEFPKDKLSEGTFWKTKNDALLALTGCYELELSDEHNDFTGWNSGIPYLCQWTDVARHKQPTDWSIGIEYFSTTGRLHERWSFNYKKISRCNYFLENIDNVDMDSGEKDEMIAEVKYIRAYCYFLLYQVYGGVPLVSEILSFDEANQINRASKDEIVDFVLSDLNEAILALPINRPVSEAGRIERGAALALKGRILMGEERWSIAAETYKEIIDMGRYEIDTRFKRLFEEEGDGSKEIIWALRYLQDSYGEGATQYMFLSGWYGGWSEMNIFQNFVDEFLMTDGETIEESNLFDPDNPFENRDPRLYSTVLLPGYTSFRGKIYQGHPDSLSKVGSAYAGHTGYALKKFLDEDYTGDPWSYGGDFIVFRYAEVLLSYLECKIENGDNITQDLLDETINEVRGRAEVNMPKVTELNPEKLMDILRRERYVELAFEGLRYWDIIRWKIADVVINRKFYGFKITNDPGSYNGKYTINEKGYLFSCEKRWNFESHNYLWPIPQTELDINPNLEQNLGY